MIIALIASMLRVSTPLLFAALGGLMCERAGVINIALEGMMLIGAFAGGAVAATTHSPWIGSLGAMLAGMLLAAIYGLFVIRLRADQIVAGTAVNMLAAGLWLRFAGEHPEALDSAGIRVNRVRWAGVLASGCLAGLGGASLSIFLASSFSRNMTAGRGFMALAALIFGKWRPIPTAAACLLFGLADAMQIRLQGVVLWGSDPVPVQFIQILPYVVTVLVLAGWVGKSRAPKALGLPFSKG